MELSSRKTSKRAIEPVDEWLQNEGYYRKHAPKDPTCLFRAISEQVYHSQRNHILVRKECVEFMRKNRQIFEEKISIPYDNYLSQMACFTQWGGENEILAMALLYQKNVVIFHGQNLTKENFIDHGFDQALNLCYTPPKQYETVYTQEYTADAGFCQSIVYQTLYKNVFKMANVDATVHKMLHERTNHLRHDKFFLKGNMEIRNQLTLELLHKIEDGEDESEEMQMLSKGITPFPYRVAKALDPNIYRNVDYDIWHEIRREVRNSGYTKFYSNELQAGSKCLVQVDLRDNDRANNNFLTGKENWDNNRAPAKSKRLEPLFYTGHIQEMSKNEGPVVVFIEELGEKMTVPYECLKPYPQRKFKQNNFPVIPNKRNTVPQNAKWKKPYNNNNSNNQTRRVKEMTPTDSSPDRNHVGNPKPVAKNVSNKAEWTTETNSENHQVKMQVEIYPSYKDYNPVVDNVKVVLENTHITSVETVERAMTEQIKNKAPAVANDLHDNQLKKQPPTNYNHDMNQPNRQLNQRVEKNEIFYPPYQNGFYPVNVHFSNDSEYVNYDVKHVDTENGEVPYSDPATVRHFYNLGVKYYCNMYPPNGVNGQPFPENTFYIIQPPPDVTVGTNMMNSSLSSNEHMNQSSSSNQSSNPSQANIPNNYNNGNNARQNFRSTTPRPENMNGSRQNGQKNNYRHANHQTHYQSQNVDLNRNRIDHKNSNVNDQQNMQNKEMQRGNKNNMAPRFKKNYDGRNRNEHQYQYNPDYRYNKYRQPQQPPQQQPQQQQQQQPQQQQQQQQQQQSSIETSTKTLEMNEAMQLQQQQQPPPQPPPPQPQSVMQQQPQTPPPMPINGGYPYPLYNQQVSYVPIGPYPIDPEAFPGHFYPGPPASFMPLPYLPPPPELADGPPGGPPLYSTMEAFPAQYPAIFSPQFVPYHMPPAVYPSPPPSSTPAGIPEGCFPGPPFPGQPYFFPYPPPPLPANIIPTPQTSPSH